MKSYVYIKLLKKVDQTIFCVDKNRDQKKYFDSIHGISVPYSSGQQVKRSVVDKFMEVLDQERAKVVMNYAFSGEGKIEQRETTELTDPRYADQLIAGWMRTPSDTTKDDDEGQVSYKRRSPLSISLMNPLHPKLVSMNKELVTFNRNGIFNDDLTIRKVKKNGKKEKTVEKWENDEIDEILKEKNELISKNKFIGPQTLVSGLFIVNMVIDIESLFTVPITLSDKQIPSEKEKELIDEGWEVIKFRGGKHIKLPINKIEEYTNALVDGLINWRISSNQSRTYDPMPIISIAVSDVGHENGYAIRSKLVQENGKISAKPVIEEGNENTKVYTTPIAGEIFLEDEINIDFKAIDKAKADIKQKIMNYYENLK